MILRVRLQHLPGLVGAVGPSLPTMTMIRCDYVNGLTLVDVLDVDVPKVVRDAKPAADMDYLAALDPILKGSDYVANTLQQPNPGSPQPISIDQATHDKWYAALDKRYPDNAGEFRPIIA